MWNQLALGIVVTLAFLWIPGFLLVRSLKVNNDLSLTFAPVVSVALYSALSIVYGFVGVPCGWYSLPLPLTVLGLVLNVWLRPRIVDDELAFYGAAAKPLSKEGPCKFLTPVRVGMLIGLVVAFATCFGVYLSSLGSPDSFIQNYDNAFHLSRIQAFADSSCFSSLAGSTYPSSWHMVAALGRDIVGYSIPCAQHVANFAFIFGVYPLGMIALVSVLFPDRPRAVWMGGLLCLVAAFWPWRIMLFGPLYPNLASYCLLPAVLVAFMSFFSSEMGRGLARKITLFILGGIALFLSQPNGVFSAAVFLIPFCLYQMRTFAVSKLEGRKHAKALSIAAEMSLALAFLMVWLLLTKVPVLHDIVFYPRYPMLKLRDAIRWGMNYSFVLWRPQFALELGTIVGLVVLAVKPSRRWIAVPYLASLFLYVVAVSVRSALKYYICGFWYSDYYRLAAMVCIFAVPVVCAAFDWFFGALRRLTRAILGKKGTPRLEALVYGAVTTLTMGCLAAYNYIPFDFISWYYRGYGFDAVQYEMRDAYQNETRFVLDLEERQFLKKVKEIVGGDAVANISYDGSAFAYATDDINVLFSLFGLDPGVNGIVIRTQLNNYITNQKAKDAVDAEQIKYVIQLDAGSSNGAFSKGGSVNLMTYHKVEWNGITQVNPNTPGFELVLSEGDCRLYRLTEVD